MEKVTPAECNMVQTDQIWKDYVLRESRAIKQWNKTYGFLPAEYVEMKRAIKAQRKGSTQEQELDSEKETLKLPPLPQHALPKQQAGGVPMTTYSEVGWRLGKRENLLEKYKMGRPKGSILKQLGWPRDAMP